VGDLMDRQDKIVILAGVVILLISIMGIVYHEKTYVASEEVKKVSYTVSWKEYSDELVDSGFVGRDGWENGYEIDLPENAYVYQVEVKIDWSDNLNFHGLILPWNWSDKIEASVNINELQFSQSAGGYEKIELDVSKDKPKDFQADVESKEELNEILKNMALNKITCNVSLSITPKPIFFDRGNDFTLHIIYHYCIPEVKTT